MAQGVENNYLAPSAPKCICQKEFLSLLNPMFPSWDFREGQLEKTLAYAEALQYWVEKANLPMQCHSGGCSPWERMLEGWTQANIPVETPATPITKELEGIQVLELEVSHSTRNGGAHQRAGPYRGIYGRGGPHWGTNHVQQASWWARCPLCSKSREKRGRCPIVTSPVGWMCCIQLSQLSPLSGPLQLLASWGGNSRAGVQGEGEPGIKEPRSTSGPCRRSPIQHYHGCPKARLEFAPPPGFKGVAACLLRDSPPWAPFEAPRNKAAQYIDGTCSSNGVHYPHSPGWGHWGYIHGHGDHLGGESGPWGPLHGGQPPRTHCGGHHWPLIGSRGRWLPRKRATMAVLAYMVKTMQIHC